MGIRSPQTTLDALYAVRDDLISGKIQNYQLGDRNITLFNITELDKIIIKYENVIVSGTPIIADISGIPNITPWPNG